MRGDSSRDNFCGDLDSGLSARAERRGISRDTSQSLRTAPLRTIIKMLLEAEKQPLDQFRPTQICSCIVNRIPVAKLPQRRKAFPAPIRHSLLHVLRQYKVKKG